MTDLCKKKKRVIVISAGRWLDSLHGISVISLFKSLASHSFGVEILLDSNTPRKLGNDSFSILALEARKKVPLFTRIFLFGHFFKHLFKKKPDVIIFDYVNIPLILLYRIFARSKGIMLILSRPVRKHNWLYLLRFRLLLMLGRLFSDEFTAISPFEANEYSRLSGIPLERITIIPSTIGENFENFVPSKNRTEARLELGLDTLLNKKVAIYHGILSEEKGVTKLVELFAESYKNDDKIFLLITGDGPARNTIENYIHRHGINNINLLGRLKSSKIPKVLLASDMGIVLHPDDPRWRYQCNIKMIELLFMGKPVLASNLPGLKWIGGNSPLVTYLTKNDPKSFKEGLTKLMSNSEKITSSTLQIRQEMIKRFSSASVALKLKNLIDSC